MRDLNPVTLDDYDSRDARFAELDRQIAETPDNPTGPKPRSKHNPPALPREWVRSARSCRSHWAVFCLDCMSRECPHIEVTGHYLTQRQLDIILLLPLGPTNQQIATSLHLSEGTVKVYLVGIFDAVGVTTRFELALWAMRNAAALARPKAPPTEPEVTK